MESMTLISIAAVAVALIGVQAAMRRAVPRPRRATNDSGGSFSSWGGGSSDCSASDGGCDGGGD
jgi:hypothetical protein